MTRFTPPTRCSGRQNILTALALLALAVQGAAASATPHTLTGAEAQTFAHGSPRWVPPLNSPFSVSGPYVPPPHPYGSGHRGIDLPAVPGAAVIAPTAGTVSFSGVVVDRGVISIQVDQHTTLSLEPVTSDLSVGDSVREGAHLGIVGNGGHCASTSGTTECVHLGVRVGGSYVNPLRYFHGLPRLVPW